MKGCEQQRSGVRALTYRGGTRHTAPHRRLCRSTGMEVWRIRSKGGRRCTSKSTTARLTSSSPLRRFSLATGITISSARPNSPERLDGGRTNRRSRVRRALHTACFAFSSGADTYSRLRAARLRTVTSAFAATRRLAGRLPMHVCPSATTVSSPIRSFFSPSRRDQIAHSGRRVGPDPSQAHDRLGPHALFFVLEQAHQTFYRRFADTRQCKG